MKVLACIDRSSFGTSVCDYAAWSAGRLGASVELLHVIERHPQVALVGDRSGRLGMDDAETLLQELADLDEARNRLAQEGGRLLLEDAAARVRAAGTAQVTQRLLHGDLIGHLKESSPEVGLIVVGRRGEAHEPAEDRLGRNLEGVIRAGHRPVFIAPQSFHPIRRFLFAYDGGRSAGVIIDLLLQSALLRDIEGELLYVGSEDSAGASHVREAAEQLRAAGYSVTTSIREGDADKLILGSVEEGRFDLLVMGAFGHSRIRERIVGSTTTSVMQRCAAAMLVVH